MKHLTLILLILCCAPTLDAQQERVLLRIDTAYSALADIWNMEMANDGENGLCMQQRSASVGTAYNLFRLPEEKIAAGVVPDSITYVMKSDVQFELWSIASTHKWFWDIGCAEPSDSLRHLTVPFATGGRSDMHYVGVGLVGCDWRPSKGTLWIDAVYAVYGTAPVDTVGTEDSTMSVDALPGMYPTDDGPLARLLDVQEHNWFSGATGARVDHGTRQAFMQRPHPPGVYFAVNGSYVWKFLR